jgi:tetratricopeptide (TPR) repeat protein
LAILNAVLSNTLAADDLATAFDGANRNYEQGNYKEAAAAYESLLRQGRASAALYFNLGNAYFKSGRTGAAIASYRVAQLLAPRDADIAANLRFARESTGGSNRLGRPWGRLLNLVTINELTLIATVLCWTWLILLAAGRLQPSWRRAVQPYGTPAAILAGAALLWLFLAWEGRVRFSSAVVVAREAVVRYGPFDEAQTSYTLRDGAELTVLDRKDSWLRVLDASRRTGWLHADDVQVLPRG